MERKSTELSNMKIISNLDLIIGQKFCKNKVFTKFLAYDSMFLFKLKNGCTRCKYRH